MTLLRIIQIDPSRSSSGEKFPLRHTKACLGQTNFGISDAEPGPTPGKIGDLLFDPNCNLRWELPIDIERGRTRHREVHDARANARIGQLVGGACRITSTFNP